MRCEGEYNDERTENKLRLSWAKLSSIGNLALLRLKLVLSLAIKAPHFVDMRSTHLAD